MNPFALILPVKLARNYSKLLAICKTEHPFYLVVFVTGMGISAEVWKFFFDVSEPLQYKWGSLSLSMGRKNDCGTPTHQTRQQWTAKDVEKNRVSFLKFKIIITLYNKKQ
jgi:hypothetical protein